ncbi:MAG: hypothetical protein Q9213_002959 [Squamulea squamosa]
MNNLTFYLDKKSIQQDKPLPSHVVFDHQNTGVYKSLQGLGPTLQQSDRDGFSDEIRQFFTHAGEVDSFLRKLRPRFHEWNSLSSNNIQGLKKKDLSDPSSFDSAKLSVIQKLQHTYSTMLYTLPADKAMAKRVVANLDAQLILIQHIRRRLFTPSSQLSKTQKHTIRKLDKTMEEFSHCREDAMQIVELLEKIEVDCQDILAKARSAQLTVANHGAVGMQEVKNVTE